MFSNIPVKELPNFARKYYLIAELFILECWWRNIQIQYYVTVVRNW